MFAAADQQSGTPAPTARTHEVMAVLVSHDGARWLPRTLAAIESSTRRPDRFVAVDTESIDSSLDIIDHCPVVDRVVELPVGTGFGEAVRAGVAAGDAALIDLTDGSGDAVRWVWVLHDDCAPEPEALAELLRRADAYPDAAIIGPKVRGWGHRGVLLECGLSLTAAGRTERHVVAGELDQGQLDGAIDVMAVGSAGMLVRRDVWDRLDGFDPAVPFHAADTNFCRRALRTGERILVAPRAVVHHRRASSAGRRGVDGRRGTQRFMARRAAAHERIVHATGWHLPLLLPWLIVTALLRGLYWLAALEPGTALDDLGGNILAVFSVRAWRGSRSLAAAATGEHRIGERSLRPGAAAQLIHYGEMAGAALGAESAVGGAATGLRRTLLAVACVAAPLGLVSLIASGGLWFAGGRLFGGALLPAPDTAGELWSAFASPWHEVGLGSATPSPAYLAVLSGLGAVMLGSATAAVQTLLLAAPVLAGLSAVIALRGIATPKTAMVAAVAYGLLPAVIAATGTGRLGTAAVAVLLPPVLRSLARLTDAVPALPRNGAASVAWGAFLLAALASFAPAPALALIVAAVIASAALRRGSAVGCVLLVAGAAAALLWPWTGHLLMHPSLALLEAGAQLPSLTDPAPDVASLFLLDPGGPAVPQRFAAVLLPLAVLALVPRASRRQAIAGWWLIVIGAALGVVQVAVPVVVGWTAQPVTAWPGPATLLMGAGALIAIAGLAGGARGPSAPMTLRIPALMVPVLVAAATAMSWLWAGGSVLQRGEPKSVAAFISAEAQASGAPRTLLLHEHDAALQYSLLSGPGPRLGDADVAPDAETMARIDEAAARLTAGGGSGTDEALAAAAVGYVAADVRADADLAARLDAVPGLRRMSTVSGTGVWQVSGARPRAYAETRDGRITPLPVTSVWPAVEVEGQLPDAAAAVRVSETSDPVWRAAADGADIPPGDGGYVTFAVPTVVDGPIRAAADPSARRAGLTVAAVVAALLLLGSLRRLRRSAAAGRRRPRPAPSGTGADRVIDLRDAAGAQAGSANGHRGSAPGQHMFGGAR